MTVLASSSRSLLTQEKALPILSLLSLFGRLLKESKTVIWIQNSISVSVNKKNYLDIIHSNSLVRFYDHVKGHEYRNNIVSLFCVYIFLWFANILKHPISSWTGSPTLWIIFNWKSEAANAPVPTPYATTNEQPQCCTIVRRARVRSADSISVVFSIPVPAFVKLQHSRGYRFSSSPGSLPPINWIIQDLGPESLPKDSLTCHGKDRHSTARKRPTLLEPDRLHCFLWIPLAAKRNGGMESSEFKKSTNV